MPLEQKLSIKIIIPLLFSSSGPYEYTGIEDLYRNKNVLPSIVKLNKKRCSAKNNRK